MASRESLIRYALELYTRVARRDNGYSTDLILDILQTCILNDSEETAIKIIGSIAAHTEMED